MLSFEWVIFETVSTTNKTLVSWAKTNQSLWVKFQLILELDCSIDNSDRVSKLRRDRCFVKYKQIGADEHEGTLCVVCGPEGKLVGSGGTIFPNLFNEKTYFSTWMTDELRGLFGEAFKKFVGKSLYELDIPVEQLKKEQGRMQDLASDYEQTAQLLGIWSDGHHYIGDGFEKVQK